MRHLLRFAALILTFLGLLLCAVYVSAVDRYFPGGARATAAVTFAESTHTRDYLINRVRAWSEEQEVPVYLVASADINHDSRQFYSFGGNADADSHRSFLPWDPDEYLDLDSLGNRSLDAPYMLPNATAEKLAGFEALIGELGGSLEWNQFQASAMFIQALLDSGAFLALISAAVLLITALVFWVYSRGRRRDLKFLIGATNREILVEDLIVVIKLVLLPSFALSLIAIGLVWLTSGNSHLHLFVATAFVMYAGLTALVVSVWVLVLFLGWPSRKALAERRRPRTELALPVEALRLVALLITALSVPVLVSGLLGVQKSAAQMHEWARLDEWVSLRLNAAPEDQETPIKDSVTELSTDDQVAFSKTMKLYGGVSTVDSTEPTLSVVLTDQRFIKLMEIPMDDPAWRPTGLDDIPVPAVELMRDSLELWFDRPERFDTDEIQFYRWVSERGLPALQPDGGELNFEDDIYVIVVSDAGKDLTGNLLLSSISTGNVLFENPARLNTVFERHGVDSLVLSVERAADAGLLRAQILNQTLWLRWTSLVLVLGALVLNTTVSAQIWSQKHAQRLFVLRTVGRSWSNIGKTKIAWEVTTTVMASIVAAIILQDFGISGYWALAFPVLFIPLIFGVYVQTQQRIFETVRRRTMS